MNQQLAKIQNMSLIQDQLNSSHNGAMNFKNNKGPQAGGLVKGRTNQAPIKGVYSKYQGATQTKEENAYMNNQ